MDVKWQIYYEVSEKKTQSLNDYLIFNLFFFFSVQGEKCGKWAISCYRKEVVFGEGKSGLRFDI